MNSLLPLLKKVESVSDLNRVKSLYKSILKDGLEGLSVDEIVVIGELVKLIHQQYMYRFQAFNESEDICRYTADLFLRFMTKENAESYKPLLNSFPYRVVKYINEKLNLKSLKELTWFLFMGENFAMSSLLKNKEVKTLSEFESEKDKQDIKAILSDDYVDRILAFSKDNYLKANRLHLENLKELEKKYQARVKELELKSIELTDEMLVGMNIGKYSEEQLDKWMSEIEEVKLEPLSKANKSVEYTKLSKEKLVLPKELARKDKDQAIKVAQYSSITKVKPEDSESKIADKSLSSEPLLPIEKLLTNAMEAHVDDEKVASKEVMDKKNIVDINKKFDQDEAIKKIKDNQRKSGTSI